jgi:galactose mutarotase-like enzyme
VLVPALGGKVRDMHLGGRQWLWHNPDVPFALPREGARYEEMEAAGGFDECFPTVGSCRLPRWVEGARWVKLPDRGELWAQPPEIAIMTDQEGHSATCTWSGAALPYQFTRRITVHPEGWVAFAYSATNTGKHRIPFLWSSHPIFPLTPRTRIVLPDGARVRLCSQSGVDFGKPGEEHTWPRLTARGPRGGKKLDLSRPYIATGGDYSCKLFVELPRREVTVVVEEGSSRLEMHLQGREIPTVGISINRQSARAPGARQSFGRWPFGKKIRAGCTIAIEPCLGAPESLRDALGKWDDAHWLEPGGTARWGMTWRAATALDGGRRTLETADGGRRTADDS